jgi:hypothetical protein
MFVQIIKKRQSDFHLEKLAPMQNNMKMSKMKSYDLNKIGNMFSFIKLIYLPIWISIGKSIGQWNKMK